jgi:hypothetical protein
VPPNPLGRTSDPQSDCERSRIFGRLRAAVLLFNGKFTGIFLAWGRTGLKAGKNELSIEERVRLHSVIYASLISRGEDFAGCPMHNWSRASEATIAKKLHDGIN